MELFEDVFTDDELLEIQKQDEKLSDEAWTFSVKHPEKQCRLVKIHTGVWVGNANYQVDDCTVNITMRIKESSIDFINIEVVGEQRSEVINQLEAKLLALQPTLLNITTTMNSFFEELTLGWSCLTKEQWIEALMMISNEKKKISGG